MTRSCLTAMLATGLVLLAVASSAAAGTFDVLACDAAPAFANNSWRGETNHGGMVVFNACPSGDSAMKGLGARTGFPYPDGWTVPTGAAARWWFDAPAGTAIVGLRANAYFEQRNNRWQVGLSNGAQLLEGCPWTASDTGGACGVHMNADEYVAVPPSSVLYTEVFCALGPCPIGGGSYYGWASLTWVAVRILDQTAPAIANAGGDLWTDGWVGGTRRVTFDASDNTGVKAVRVTIDGALKIGSERSCDVTVTRCPNWSGAALDVATGQGVADGKHSLTIEVVDRADNVGSMSREVRIDNTPPAAPIAPAVEGGDGWKAKNAFTVRWKNPPQNAAPIAGAEYRLCPVGGATSDCIAGSRSGRELAEIKDLEVPRPGDWALSLALRDAAGNSRAETAAAPLHLRFDPDPPELALQPLDPEDPARVRVMARDAISGIARGEIAIRRQGTDTWQVIPATLESGGFSAMLDDVHLRDGVYDVSAHTWDAAWNERSSDRRVNGETAKLILPLRIKTHMRVGKRRKLVARGSRRGRRVRVAYLRRPLVNRGRKVRLRGRLTAPGGNALAGVDVEVASRPALPGAPFQPVATLKSSRTGRFGYTVPAGPSRILRFRYPGTPKVRAQTREIHVRVRAATTLHVSDHRVVNGEPVTFTGRLLGGFLPATGKLVEVQYKARGKWRTFRTARAAPSAGRWRSTYRFDGTRGTEHYRFRVRVPRESGYPFSTGYSRRRVGVTVRGL